MASGEARPLAALADVTNCSMISDDEPAAKRIKLVELSPGSAASPIEANQSPSRNLGSPPRTLGSPTRALGSPTRTPGSPARTLGSPTQNLGSPSWHLSSPFSTVTPGSPTKPGPLTLRDMPRVPSRRGIIPPPPPSKPSRTARPRPKFTPKSQNLQALLHNEWHDISIANGPYEKAGVRCYDILVHSFDGSSRSFIKEWPEEQIRRGQVPPGASTEDLPPKRFPLGCIVWARVKGAHDWTPGWVIQMPKGEAPPHMRDNPDAYCVQLFGNGIYAFVEDSHGQPDIYPFDMEPPRSEDKPMFGEDVDQKISAIQQALQIYFHGMDQETQESVLQWRGPLRIVHRMLNKVNILWDQAVKAEALELTVDELRSQQEAAAQQRQRLEEENAILKQQLDGTRNLGRRLSSVTRMEEEKLELQRKVTTLETELQQSSHEKRASEVNPQAIEQLQSEIAALVAQRDHFHALIEESATALEEQTKAATQWQGRCEELTAKNASLERSLTQSEAECQRLKYTVMELKGNLRVVCRVRPSTEQEQSQPMALFRFPEDNVVQLCTSDGRQHTFNLDKAFQPSATNSDVFHEVAPLVQSVLDGYHICLFTYGQTGSGKTWTMQGPSAMDGIPVQEKDVGLISRAMEQIYANVELLKADGWEHEIAVKIVEIYNEVVYDLLCNELPRRQSVLNSPTPFKSPINRTTLSKPLCRIPPRVTAHSPAPRISSGSRHPSTPIRLTGSQPKTSIPRPGPALHPASPQQQRRISLKFHGSVPKSGTPHGPGTANPGRPSDAKSSVDIDPISTHPVLNLEDLQTLLQRASERRAQAQTSCNDQSSRSHFLCLISIQGTNAAQGLATHGVLNMVDLAGSERLSKSGSMGDQLKETQHINKSLFCLRDVITAIGNNARFIPFRNSKLTWLLKDSLTNNAKVLTLVTLSPTLEAEHETLCSLRFAGKAHCCELGAAKRDISSISTPAIA